MVRRRFQHTDIMNKVRETREQWDDVPAKVVGRRHNSRGGWKHADVLQRRINEGMQGKTRWPKGVFRFESFEEADAWWIQNIHFLTK